MSFFVDVILPLKLDRFYTYEVNQAEFEFIQKGVRVLVPFGKSKTYTALVFAKHKEAPTAYEAKAIIQILDDKPLISEDQFTFWTWVKEYYLATYGDVFLNALPSFFRLDSEQEVFWLGLDDFDSKSLSDDEFLVFEALESASSVSVKTIMKLLGKKQAYRTIGSLKEKDLIQVEEKVYQKYKEKTEAFIRLSDFWEEKGIEELLDSKLIRSENQRVLLLAYFSLVPQVGKEVNLKKLLEQSGQSRSVLTGLIKKEVFLRINKKSMRVQFSKQDDENIVLSNAQQSSLKDIYSMWESNQVCLFKGVEGSGKSYVFLSLIQKELSQGKDVLLLVPETGIAQELRNRWSKHFGNQMLIYHGKYSQNERVEVWQQLFDAKNQGSGRLVIGTGASLYLPFQDLGLIIVDEEHDSSYKQRERAPMIQVRDAAVVLGIQNQAKVLLSSATPSLESMQNASSSKYGFVNLEELYTGILRPQIELVDMKEAHKKHRVKGHFSKTLIEGIEKTIADGQQVILFQNRRGYAPLIECKRCGHSPQCPNCDVSLTLHRFAHELRCHYCNHKQSVPKTCPSCGSYELDSKGFGTEQISAELETLFPAFKVGRLDLDTTRGKNGFDKIVGGFRRGETQILVGTQMLFKGIDFANVGLVGVMNADTMLNFPDFRAAEKSYHLLSQISTRTGRGGLKGRVLIQSFNPYHQILQQVSYFRYKEMYKEQLEERYQFKYPPFYRLIEFTFKHRDRQTVVDGSNWYTARLKNGFGDMVLGPSIPSIERIRNQYLRTILLKIPLEYSLREVKLYLRKIEHQFHSIAAYRAITVIRDVDPN